LTFNPFGVKLDNMKLDLKNNQFGRLEVIKKIDSRLTSGGHPVAQWLCRCSCGKEKVVSAGSLVSGKTKSCGCGLVDWGRKRGYQNTKHGFQSKFVSSDNKIKWQALINIQDRSRRRGYTSDLEISDLPELTATCPVLGIPYKKGSLKDKDASPSIDRKNPNLPYLKQYKDNLVFISHRANRIKSNATVEELEKIIAYMQGHSPE